LLSCDWSWLSQSDANHGAEKLTAEILKIGTQFIPRRHLYERKSTHPWINEEVVRAVRDKLAAQGTTMEADLTKRCSACIMGAYGKHVARERKQLQELPKGAKAWWSRSRRLMQNKMLFRACLP